MIGTLKKLAALFGWRDRRVHFVRCSFCGDRRRGYYNSWSDNCRPLRQRTCSECGITATPILIAKGEEAIEIDSEDEAFQVFAIVADLADSMKESPCPTER